MLEITTIQMMGDVNDWLVNGGGWKFERLLTKDCVSY